MKDYTLFVQPGWSRLVMDMIDAMHAALEARGYSRDDLKITQIKQKFGTLRCYYEAPIDLDDIVDAAEMRSAHTCEECGRIGRVQGNSYICAICDYCKSAKPNFNGTDLDIGRAPEGFRVSFRRREGRHVTVFVKDLASDGRPYSMTCAENDVTLAVAELMNSALEKRQRDEEMSGVQSSK